jgi:hypothetical protein
MPEFHDHIDLKGSRLLIDGSAGVAGQFWISGGPDDPPSWYTLPVASTSEAGLQPATSYAAITYASTVTLNMAALNEQVRVINVTGPLTLALSNIANGQRLTLRLVIDGTDRSLTVPGWKRFGYNSTTLKAGKVYRLVLQIFGTSNVNEIDLAIAEEDGSAGTAGAARAVRVDAGPAGSIYVGTAPSGSSESASIWTIVYSQFNSAGIKTSEGTAVNTTWTGRTGHTYT